MYSIGPFFWFGIGTKNLYSVDGGSDSIMGKEGIDDRFSLKKSQDVNRSKLC